MFRICCRADFDSAHFLAGYVGKCANLHGHRWVIEAEVVCRDVQENGEKRGMVMDFSDFKKSVRSLAEEVDHALIYEVGTLAEGTVDALLSEGFRLVALPFRPTAELMAKYFWERLDMMHFPVSRVTVWETPENCAVYEVENETGGAFC